MLAASITLLFAIEIGKAVIDEQYMRTLRGTVSYLESQIAPRISKLHRRNIVIQLSLPLPEPKANFIESLLTEVENQICGSSIKSPRLEPAVLGTRVTINQRDSTFGYQTSFRVSYAVSMTRGYLRSPFLKQVESKLQKAQLCSAQDTAKRVLLIDNMMGICAADASEVVASLRRDETRFVDDIFLVGPDQVVQLHRLTRFPW